MLKENLMTFLIVAIVLSIVCIIVVIVNLAVALRNKNELGKGEISDEEYENRCSANAFNSAFKWKDADCAVYLNEKLLPLREGQEGKSAAGYYCFQDCERCAYVDDCENSKI